MTVDPYTDLPELRRNYRIKGGTLSAFINIVKTNVNT